MRLRKLELKDASLMLEWMHDESVTNMLNNNFSSMTIDDCINFIKNTNDDNLHMAIVDDTDTYMGTVSLKNIDLINANAEFAITVRSIAMGKGYSQFAMSEIIRIGFDKLGIDKIYWYVDKENQRAIRFYDKNGYARINYNDLKLTSFELDSSKYIWYESLCAKG